jgi:hypothetical protein
MSARTFSEMSSESTSDAQKRQKTAPVLETRSFPHTILRKLGSDPSNPYRGPPAKICNVKEARDLFKSLGPISPCYFDSGSCLGQLATLFVPDATIMCARYFGYLDLDANFEKVCKGEERLNIDEPERIWKSSDAKQAFYDLMVQYPDMVELSEHCPPYKRLLDATREIAVKLHASDVPCHTYLSGGKGTRVLICNTQPELWKLVSYKQEGCGRLGRDVVSKFLKKRGVSETSLHFIDDSPYNFLAGLKNDVLPHPNMSGFDVFERYDGLFEGGALGGIG